MLIKLKEGFRLGVAESNTAKGGGICGSAMGTKLPCDVLLGVPAAHVLSDNHTEMGLEAVVVLQLPF